MKTLFAMAGVVALVLVSLSAAQDDSARQAPNENRVLILGGGTSHDFNKWFNEADTALLKSDGHTSVKYTDRPGDIVEGLKRADVLYQSSNQEMPSAARQAMLDFANAGKGLLLVHAGLWYNWGDWPEYNAQLAGGGARSHDRLGEFEVTVTQPDHPIMKGVPEKFKIIDELYHFVSNPKGAGIEVLATATSPVTGKTFPSVWIVRNPKAHIAGIALGHDGRAHNLPAYQTILRNAARWAARK